MNRDLDSLKTEIPAELESRGLAVFHSLPRVYDPNLIHFWDIENYPDFRQFLDIAEKLAVKLVVYSHHQFSTGIVDDAMARLQDAELSREERRAFERRLRDMRGYDGFTCGIDLCFEYQNRIYLFDLRTSWYSEMLDLLDEIDDALPEPPDEDEDEEMGGYFSRN